jgi:hypothetical protein
MAKNILRDAQASLPSAYVVTPEGLLKSIPYGAGINGGIVEFVSGRGPRVTSEARERGFVMLSEMYKDEGRDAEYAEYCRFREMARAGKVNPDSFPEKALPKALLERRAKSSQRPEKLPEFQISAGNKGK